MNYREKLKELYSRHPYTHLDSTINILLYCPLHISIHLFITQLIFLKKFTSKWVINISTFLNEYIHLKEHFYMFPVFFLDLVSSPNTWIAHCASPPKYRLSNLRFPAPSWTQSLSYIFPERIWFKSMVL